MLHRFASIVSSKARDRMKEELRRIAEALFQGHSNRTIGLVAGMVFGAAVLFIGFWHTVFVFACGLLGLWIGTKIDCGEDIFEIIERYLPERFHRFR